MKKNILLFLLPFFITQTLAAAADQPGLAESARILQELNNDKQLTSQCLAIIEKAKKGRRPSLDKAMEYWRTKYDQEGFSSDPFREANAKYYASEYDAANAAYEKNFQGDTSFATEDQHRIATINHGETLLALGRYKEGFTKREARLKKGYTPLKKPWANDRRKKILKGKTILIRREGGIGDTVMFGRFLRTLKHRCGARIICEANNAERHIVERIDAATIIAKPGETPEKDFDYDIYAMSLPLHLDQCGYGCVRSITDVPANSYITGDPKRVAYWRNQLLHLPGLHFGINWQTSKNPAGVVRVIQRNIPLAELATLSKIKGITLHNFQGPDHRPISKEWWEKIKNTPSVQRAPEDAQLDEHDILPADCVVTTWQDFDKRAPFSDVIAFAQAAKETQKGSVISVDTAVAHAAAATGLRTHWLLTKQADWRWGKNNATSAWYPMSKLYYQEKQGDWSQPMAALTKDITALATEEEKKDDDEEKEIMV